MSEKNPHQLNIPRQIGKDEQIADISTAYVQAGIQLPACIAELTEKLDEMNDYICETKDSLLIIARYFRKKGFEENLFTPDEFKEIDNDDESD